MTYTWHNIIVFYNSSEDDIRGEDSVEEVITENLGEEDLTIREEESGADELREVD